MSGQSVKNISYQSCLTAKQNLNSPISIKNIQFIILVKTVPQRNLQSRMASLVHSIRHLWNE